MPTVRQVDQLWSRLLEEDFPVGRYHAKMKTAEREEAQQVFMSALAPIEFANPPGSAVSHAICQFLIHPRLIVAVRIFSNEIRAWKTALICAVSERLEGIGCAGFYKGNRATR